MSTSPVLPVLRRLPLTRLAHFTPAKNLWYIAKDGQIRSSKDLAEQASDYFSPTDPDRYDMHPDKVCCSFEYPNVYYQAIAKGKPKYWNYPDWVCLFLSRDLLLRPDVQFSPCSATRGRGAYARPGGQALSECYASPSRPDGRWTRGPKHHPAAATDLQAEALIPGTVDVNDILAIAVHSEGRAIELYGVLERYHLGPERFRWIIAPTIFDRGILPSMIRFGGTIAETELAPPFYIVGS